MKSRKYFPSIGDYVETANGIKGFVTNFYGKADMLILNVNGRFVIASSQDVRKCPDETVDPGASYRLPFGE